MHAALWAASLEARVSNNKLEIRRSGIKFAWLSIFDSIQEPVTVWRSNQDRVICFVFSKGIPCSDARGDVIRIELIAGSKSCDSVRRSSG